MIWAQKGHRRCILTGTNAHIDGIVGVRVSHVMNSRVK